MCSVTDKRELTGAGHACNGAASFAIALIPTEPLFALKTWVQAGNKGLPPVTRLWAGYPANAGSGIPCEALAFFVNAFGVKLFSKGAEDKPNPYSSLALSLVSGALGAPINASLEQGMIRQQLFGGKFFGHLGDIYTKDGLRGIFRGTAATAGRDAFFVAGVFALNDIAKEILTQSFKDSFALETAAGLSAGVVAGIASNPFDLIKTLMQSDKDGATYKTFLDTTKKIVADGGIRGLFRGCIVRAGTIGALCAATAMAKARVPDYLPKSFFEERS